MQRAETTLVRHVRRRVTPSQAPKEAVGPPPPGATILTGDVALIDEDSGEVVAVQATVVPQLANRIAQQLHGIKWGAERGRSNSDNEARLSGIMAASATFGYTFPNPLRRRYACCTSGFDRMHPKIAADLAKTATAAHSLFRSTANDVYLKTTHNVYERIAQPWRLGGSPWTSGILNNSVALPYHKDSGNIPGAWSAMLTCRNHCEGGVLHLADYDVYLGLPNGSISIFDGQSVLHGVTPFTMTKPHGHRYTCVFYSPSRMAVCADTRDGEVLRAQKRATEAEDARRNK
jgi:hypothetical protein